jgi:phosphoribosyl 1,2-cyclic phosphodiesterase
MFSLTVLGSGSAGNAAVVRTRSCNLLIDSGLSARQIVGRLGAAGVDAAELDGILLTHEHIDHASGLEVFCKKYEVPIYCNAMTAEALQYRGGSSRKDWRIFATGAEFSLKDIIIETFPVPHDAVDPVGFILHHGNAAIGVLTDLGFATKLVRERVKIVHTLLIEANHDEKMLQEDVRRPWPVKQRIMSRHGHLSNDGAAAVVGELLDHRLQRVVLGHLSRDCNSPEVALRVLRSHLERLGARPLELFCASQREITECFSVDVSRQGQLDFF